MIALQSGCESSQAIQVKKMTVEILYHRVVKPLTVRERLRLVALIANDLAADLSPEFSSRKLSLSQLQGLGAEIWEGIDAQEYVNQLRDEWDRPERYGESSTDADANQN